MFVLHPHGKEGSGGASMQSQKIWYFAQVGLYFVGIRCAYMFFAGREQAKAIKN